MRPNQKKHLLNDIIIVIMLLAALLTIIRLWPLLLLLLIGLIAYALWVLFQTARQPPEPLLMLPAPVSQRSIMTSAFGLLQHRISEQVNLQYPNARWVWSVSDAFNRFTEGQALSILLNGAGGSRKATVQISHSK